MAIDGFQIEGDYAFVVLQDDLGMPVRVSPVFGVREPFGELFDEPLDEEEQGFVIVSFDRPSLETEVSGFLNGRREELSAAIRRPPATPELIQSADRLAPGVWSRLPADARFVSRALEEDGAPLTPIDDSRLREQISIRVPVDAEHCRLQESEPLYAFAADDRPLEALVASIPNATSDDVVFHGLHWVDDDTLLMQLDRGVAVLHRGQPFAGPQASFFLTRDDPLYDPVDPIPEVVADVAIAPSLAPDGRREIMVVGGESLPDELGGLYGRAWRLWLSPDGTLELADTIRREGRLWSVIYLADGRLLAGGDDAQFLQRTETGTSGFAPLFDVDIGINEDRILQMEPTASPDFPLLAGSKSRLHLFDTNLGIQTQRAEMTGVVFSENIPWGGLATFLKEDGNLEFWGAGIRGHLFKGEAFDRIASTNLFLPPRFLPCASAGSTPAMVGFNQKIYDLVPMRSHVIAVFEGCTALVQIRRSDGCMALLLPPDEEAEVTEFDLVSRGKGDQIAVGYSDGRVLTTEFP